jgi:hypothetical protein
MKDTSHVLQLSAFQVLYLINIILNITAADIVKSYKENLDEDTDYDSMYKYQRAVFAARDN